MKIKEKIIFVLLLLLINFSSAQSFPYKWIETTGEVTSFEKVIINFSHLYYYDMDFEKRTKSSNPKVSLLIEKPNRYRSGRLVLSWGHTKDNFKILSCYYKKYANSSKKYYQFKCEGEKGKIIYFNLEKDEDWALWRNMSSNERVYFTKSSSY
jgi:hypothetical protein